MAEYVVDVTLRGQVIDIVTTYRILADNAEMAEVLLYDAIEQTFPDFDPVDVGTYRYNGSSL